MPARWDPHEPRLFSVPSNMSVRRNALDGLTVATSPRRGIRGSTEPRGLGLEVPAEPCSSSIRLANTKHVLCGAGKCAGSPVSEPS